MIVTGRFVRPLAFSCGYNAAMLTRRQWILGWSNLPAAFSQYRQVHPSQEDVTFSDLLEFIGSARGIEKLAGACGIYCHPIEGHWLAIEPLLLEMIEQEEADFATGDVSSKQPA